MYSKSFDQLGGGAFVNIKQIKGSLLLFLMVFFWSISNVWAVDIKTTLDRNPVAVNESFQLTFTASESPDNDPDFSVLDENFEILNRSKNSNVSWVNGKSTRTVQWVLTVIAKRAGKLFIPPVSFGGDLSQPTSIIVNKNASVDNKGNEDLFIELEVSPETAFVQSQVLYTIRVYSRVQVAQAQLSELKVTDALIEKLGEGKNYNTELNGVAYVVTEIKYAIFPQKSGVIKIAPLVLTAQVASGQQRGFNGFFRRQTTRTTRTTSKEITLNIKPTPAEFTGKRWLPAEYVHIEEKWSEDTEKMILGEPITRTITLLAKGVTAAQLPEIQDSSVISRLKTYPDQPVLKEKKQEDGLISMREEKIAYIASKAGQVVLPAIEIPWFNTQTQKMEVVRIPERTVVAIASGQPKVNLPAQALPVEAKDIVNTSIIQTVENKFWMYISIGLAVGWLMTVILWITSAKKKQLPSPQIKNIANKETNIKYVVKQLKKACIENNALAAKAALLDWGKLKFDSQNLSEIANHSEARLRDEIYLLSQSLYANQQQEDWKGKKLFQFFIENNVREKMAKPVHDVLEPLYKM